MNVRSTAIGGGAPSGTGETKRLIGAPEAGARILHGAPRQPPDIMRRGEN